MTDAEVPAAAPDGPQRDGGHTGTFIGLGIGGLVVFVAIVTVVLMVSLSVIGSNGLPMAAAKRALLTAHDVLKISGVEIASDGVDSEIQTHSLQAYVRENPGDTSNTVTPAKCADNLEGWMAWKSLDTPSYRGWKTDTIYESSNIIVDSTASYENGLQEARHFATVAAATAFMSAQRSWYRDCTTTTYVDPAHPKDNSSFHYSPISLNLGLDTVAEGSTDSGRGIPPHLIDVYLRNQNIVYVTELVTNTAPQHGIDNTSREILTAAAKKLASL
jgi:hypothetical protein